ncbi:MAG: ParB/RepB/Spo0J family partition protein [Limnochordaceae bacterium]|nr:ParB/RepB/Spo0J family partition protein [Limnochordaceae bacterium]
MGKVSLERIRTDAAQCRTSFDPDQLEGLRRSLEAVGQLHPVLVRPEGDYYRLIAGERRVRAARLAGWSTIEAVILPPGTEEHDPEVQLIENLQREDLNPIDKAQAVRRFMDQNHLSKVEAADRLGIPRTTLTDWLNCLEVDPRFQQAVIRNFQNGSSPITASHVSIALGLARKLLRPDLTEELLACTEAMELSKAELRQVARILEADREISAQDAAERVRARAASRRRAAAREKGKPEPEWKDEVTQLLDSLERELAHVRENLSRLSRYAQEQEDEQQFPAAWKQMPERLMSTYEMLTRVLKDVFHVDSMQTAEERYRARRRAWRRAQRALRPASRAVGQGNE